MFLWIRDQKWLPALFVSLTLLLLAGGIDLSLQGPQVLWGAVVLAASIAFARALPWLSFSLAVIGLLIPTVLDLQPQLSQIATFISLLIVAAFGDLRVRVASLISTVLLSSFTTLWFILTLATGETLYGVELPTSESKLALSLVGCVIAITLAMNAWLLGRLLFTRITHVGTDFDKALLEHQILSAQLAVAEADRRFGIARDVTDLLIEQVSSTMVAAESGTYALQSDPSIAPRLVANLSDGVKKAFAELRRLSDLLGLQNEKAYALPGLRDLNGLFISYRQFGYGVNFRETGTAMELTDGASLIIYRIVFESLENIRKHAPLGTSVDLDFIWQAGAFQVLIKDNGEETLRAQNEDSSGYEVADDQKALVEHLTGPGLTAMAERAKLYEGIIEFTRVPGVGFTVSASFPNIAKYSKVS